MVIDIYPHPTGNWNRAIPEHTIEGGYYLRHTLIFIDAHNESIRILGCSGGNRVAIVVANLPTHIAVQDVKTVMGGGTNDSLEDVAQPLVYATHLPAIPKHPSRDNGIHYIPSNSLVWKRRHS